MVLEPQPPDGEKLPGFDVQHGDRVRFLQGNIRPRTAHRDILRLQVDGRRGILFEQNAVGNELFPLRVKTFKRNDNGGGRLLVQIEHRHAPLRVGRPRTVSVARLALVRREHDIARKGDHIGLHAAGICRNIIPLIVQENDGAALREIGVLHRHRNAVEFGVDRNARDVADGKARRKIFGMLFHQRMKGNASARLVEHRLQLLRLLIPLQRHDVERLRFSVHQVQFSVVGIVLHDLRHAAVSAGISRGKVCDLIQPDGSGNVLSPFVIARAAVVAAVSAAVRTAAGAAVRTAAGAAVRTAAGAAGILRPVRAGDREHKRKDQQKRERRCRQSVKNPFAHKHYSFFKIMTLL